MELKLKLDEAAVAKLQKEFRWIPGASEKALCAALNRTAAGVRTDITRSIAQRYFVKQGDVRSSLSVRKASRSRLQASVRSEGAVIRLIKFRTSPKSVTKRGPRVGVKVQVEKGSGGKRIPGTFIAAGGSTTGVFRRKGTSRLPIEQLFGPAIPSMIGNDEVFGELQRQADARLTKEVDQQIYRILRGFGS